MSLITCLQTMIFFFRIPRSEAAFRREIVIPGAVWILLGLVVLIVMLHRFGRKNTILGSEAARRNKTFNVNGLSLLRRPAKNRRAYFATRVSAVRIHAYRFSTLSKPRANSRS
jgi:hypothetical protein